MIKNLFTLITLILFLAQCNKNPAFTKIDMGKPESSSANFSKFCNSFEERGSNPDYIYNQFDEVKKAIAYYENYRSKASIEVENSIDAEELLILEQELNNPDLSVEDKELIELMISAAKGEDIVKKNFADATTKDAQSYILEQAKKYHLLLLNEAHNSSQQRAFTTSLLKGLWANGYRYLALETFTWNKFDLNKKGYPTTKTGYYTLDPVFGNMVREAIKLGYTLVPYEINPSQDSADRERIQAKNIYERTFQNDPVGKVVVHAGYSHISKNDNGTHSLMGYYLNEYASGQVLSVDQETMSYKGKGMNNDYYDFAITNYEIKKPSVILNDNKVVIDPINRIGNDIQVYHPKIAFINGRPMWLYGKYKTNIALTAEMKEHEGKLIRAQLINEDENSIPLDQFVINQEKQLLLPPGSFIISIIDCEDKIVSKYSLEVN
jgi:hypothetical protein